MNGKMVIGNWEAENPIVKKHYPCHFATNAGQEQKLCNSRFKI
jgi:hypothetical protein